MAKTEDEHGGDSQSALDERNSSFWDELCGTSLATYLGITDNSASSLRKFDNWYVSIYPYVFLHVPFESIRDKKVLEIGLGYGTVSQLLVEFGAQYTGLDIARGPVNQVNHRIGLLNLEGKAQQGSILEAPFEDNSFDYVIAFGCLHHTGNLQKALDECYRVLKPGGQLIGMVYYAYSHRRWYQHRSATLKYFFKELFGYRGIVGATSESEKAESDANAKGEAAPHVDFISKRSMRKLCSKFSKVQMLADNINQEPPHLKTVRRELLLRTFWPRIWGLDLYFNCQK